jgi:hypothetical protein
LGTDSEIGKAPMFDDGLGVSADGIHWRETTSAA